MGSKRGTERGIRLNLESSILNSIRLAAKPAILFRNQRGAYTTKDGYFIRYGVGDPGGSDLIGITPITVTRAMIGRKIGVFTAIECKNPHSYTNKKRLAEQTNFIRVIVENGGLGGFAVSPEEARGIIRGL